MDTSRVKNIMIVLLSVAIVVLSVLIFMEGERYTLTADGEENVIAVLARNQVTVSTEIPRDFRPRRQLNLGFYDYDLEGIAARFFGEIEFGREIAPNFVEYYCDYTGQTMTRQNRGGYIGFAIPEGLLLGDARYGFAKNSASAEALAHTFIEQVLESTPMAWNSTFLTWNGNYVITFFDEHEGYLLFNNQIRVRITEAGIVSAFYSRTTNSGFIGDAGAIFSPDEAMLALLIYLRTTYATDLRIDITAMRLVYAMGTGGRGVPAYFFTVTKGDGHWVYYHLINAYTNTIIPSGTTVVSGPHL